MEWTMPAAYPLVLKLAGGAGSTNVKLLKHAAEARFWIERLFSRVIRRNVGVP
jgi:hypothetical protein